MAVIPGRVVAGGQLVKLHPNCRIATLISRDEVATSAEGMYGSLRHLVKPILEKISVATRTWTASLKPTNSSLVPTSLKTWYPRSLLLTAQARSLEYAVYAGKVVTEIKEHLKTSTTLLTFKKFLEVYCPELKQRSANTYQQVYMHVSKNSKTSYSNISEVLKDWRKDHPKRSRFVAMAENSKKMLSEVPTPELPDAQKVESIGMLEWLEPKPDQLFVFTSDPPFTVQKVERSGKDYPSYKFLTDPVPLKKYDNVRIYNNTRGGQTVCELLAGRSSKNKYFRIATDQFSKHFTPEEKVSPVPPPNKDTDATDTATDTQVEFSEVARAYASQ